MDIRFVALQQTGRCRDGNLFGCSAHFESNVGTRHRIDNGGNVRSRNGTKAPVSDVQVNEPGSTFEKEYRPAFI